MIKPLGKTEFTKIYNGYAKQFAINEMNTTPNGQDLPSADPNAGTDKPDAQSDAVMKEFTNALTNLGTVLGKLKHPQHIENANKAIQQMLAKKPNQAAAPVQGVQPNQGPQSPSTQSNNNTPLN